MDLPIDAGDDPLHVAMSLQLPGQGGPTATPELPFYFPSSSEAQAGVLALSSGHALAPATEQMAAAQAVAGDLCPDASIDPGTDGQLFVGSDEAFACWTQDPMELDYDIELASWVNSWGLPLSRSPSHQQQPSQQRQQHQQHQHRQHQHHHRSQSQPQHQQHQQSHRQGHHLQLPQQSPAAPLSSAATPVFNMPSMPASFVELNGLGTADARHVPGPDDLLFPDDETVAVVCGSGAAGAAGDLQQSGVLPTSAPVSLLQQPATAAAALVDLNDPTTLDLYDEMLLFSRGNHQADHQLVFDECDAAKEAILRRLSMKLKLSYSYNPGQRRACIWKPSMAAAAMPAKRTHPMERRRHSFQPPEAGFVVEDDDAYRSGGLLAANPHYHSHGLARVDGGARNKRHTLSSPLIFTSPPIPQSDVGSSDSSAATSAAIRLGGADEDDESTDSPSLGDRLSNSWSIFHSGISSRRPRGRRGPLSAKSRKDIKDLEWAGGACWRCKILRRKCDPGVPCKNCPAPDLREDAPPWPLIGCRRGSLRDAMPPQVLCTRSRALLPDGSTRRLSAVLESEQVLDSLPGAPVPGQPDVVSQCFHEAEAQCLFDNKLVLENPSMYLRAHGKSDAAQHYSQAIRNGRYRANESLNATCQVHDRTTTYSELIARIAWDLADNGESLCVLEIESVESFMQLLETACVYEVEVGKSPMVALSIVCLRCCMDALRLSAANLLSAQLHGSCQKDRCGIDCLCELALCIETYIEELSLLMFRKVNLRDRRWWLSTFYSLCIQAYVRRALLAVEQQLLFPGTDDVDVDVLYSSQYLHLVTVLFIAVSFQYDPLVAGNGGLQLQQALLAEEDGPGWSAGTSTSASSALASSVPERYFAVGRAACAVDMWLDEGIKSSYQFLTRLLNIGSLDFDMGATTASSSSSRSGDAAAMEMATMAEESSDAVLPLRRLQRGSVSVGGPRRDDHASFSGYSTPNSSSTSFASSMSASRSNGITSPPSSCGPLSSASSPRASLLVSDRRSSIGSLPSRLSVASFPAPASTSTDFYSGVPPKGMPHMGPSLTAVASMPAMAGHFICTCCPKRPQRFDTDDELRLHQTKKPHICAFCGRRFSRMNEAERHITTIHLRPFSWSCGRLHRPLQAYQQVSDGTVVYDVCGFCGRQFQRPEEASGAEADSQGDGQEVGQEDGREGIPEHDERLTVHIEQDHKLHECKVRGKKFYREDMFGQHLKLSHAAEPGIWLKYMENVCKADEEGAAEKI